MRKSRLNERFGYHTPTEEQYDMIDDIRKLGLNLVLRINEYAPDCADKATAIMNIEQGVMWANKAIVVGEEAPKPLGGPLGGDEPDGGKGLE